MFEPLKKSVADSAIHYIPFGSIVGVGSGSTINYFIQSLYSIRSHIRGTVSSSLKTTQLLKKNNIKVFDLNDFNTLDIYVDSADFVNENLELIKGGGGALTREKIIASASKKFLCIIDKTKRVKNFFGCSVPIEVLPMSLNFVIKEISKLGGISKYRENFITDNGNIIIDVFNLCFFNNFFLEKMLNNIPGVLTSGIFSIRKADILLISDVNSVKTIIY